MNPDLLYKILCGLIAPAATVYTFFKVMEHAVKTNSEQRLYFGYWYLSFVLSFYIVPTVSLIYIFFVDSNYPLIIFLLVSALFISVGLYFSLEYLRTKARVESDGIFFSTLWGGAKYYRWADLTEIEYNRKMYWYILYFGDNKKIRLSAMMVGCNSLVSKLLTQQEAL